MSARPGGGLSGGPAMTVSELADKFKRKPPEYVMVEVLYATDRKPIEGLSLTQWRQDLRDKGSTVAYYGDEHGELQFGDCIVSIPAAKHQPGVVERPEWYRTENIVYDITLRGLIPLSAEQIRERIAKMAAASQPDSDAFVFIHGFNVSFNEAVMRTAQIAYDFKFVGAPILYSWPSSGKMTMTAYNHDANITRAAEDSLYQFLNDIVLKAGSKKIHLVAHSMGNQVLLEALKRFSNEGRGGLFSEIIMAAPDVAQEVFKAAGPKKIAALGQRVTLYASSKDLALLASGKFNALRRLGESGDKLFLAEGIDTIDASDVKNGNTDGLGHSPFSSAVPVMMDLARLLVKGIAPGVDPRNLMSVPRGSQSYWTFKE